LVAAAYAFTASTLSACFLLTGFPVHFCPRGEGSSSGIIGPAGGCPDLETPRPHITAAGAAVWLTQVKESSKLKFFIYLDRHNIQ